MNAAQAKPARTKPPRRPTSRMDHITAYCMALPALILLGIFVYYPLWMALQKSFTDWNFYTESKFVGFENFRLVLVNENFRNSILVSIKFLVILVPIQMIVSFLFAHVLMQLKGPYASFVKTSIYVPHVISGVIAAVIFAFILNYRAGLINEVLRAFGISRIAFLTKPWLALISICTPIVWLGFGNTSLVMFAGLQNIPIQYYEAANVDGANALQRMIFITIPSMRNVFVLLSVGMIAGSLQLYDIPFMMTGGGPVNSTLTPMIYLINNFKAANVSMGYTVAGALLMMLAIGALNSIVFFIVRSEKAMDA